MTRFADALFDSEFALGMTSYLDHFPGEPQQRRIVLDVELDGIGQPVPAVIDTGATWCIFDPGLLSALDIDQSAGLRIDADRAYNIRGYLYTGWLVRIPITLLAAAGTDLTIDATVFYPDHDEDDGWHVPNVVGLDGFLDRLRFAVDSSSNTFYFGTDDV